MLQVGFNLLKSAAKMTHCVEEPGATFALRAALYFSTFFGSLLTNILCHRYLLEKAYIMTQHM
jgi:hypothetical protein